MGTNYKAALIPQRIRETIHGWGKAARRKRRLRMFADDTTIHTETSTVLSLEDDDRRLIDDTSETTADYTAIELQLTTVQDEPDSVTNERPSRARTPLLQPSTSLSSAVDHKFEVENFMRSFSMPVKR